MKTGKKCTFFRKKSGNLYPFQYIDRLF